MIMPRGNLKNFGKKLAHAFGSPERAAADAAKPKKATRGRPRKGRK